MKTYLRELILDDNNADYYIDKPKMNELVHIETQKSILEHKPKIGDTCIRVGDFLEGKWICQDTNLFKIWKICWKKI